MCFVVRYNVMLNGGFMFVCLLCFVCGVEVFVFVVCDLMRDVVWCLLWCCCLLFVVLIMCLCGFSVSYCLLVYGLVLVFVCLRADVCNCVFCVE